MRHVGIASIAAIATTVLLHAGTVRAEGGSPLLLPLGVALAVAQSAQHVHRAASATGVGEPPNAAFLSKLPRQLWVPDLYKVDVDRDTPRYAAPIDNDRWVALDLLPSRVQGWTMRAAFDHEAPAPLGRGSTLLQVMIHLKW